MQNFLRLKWACYFSNVCMSIVSAFIPLLFVAFHDMYNISYTALGALVLINFFTQLLVDLIYSIFPKKLNVKHSLHIMPVITLIGLIFLALVPIIFSNVYIGIVIGVIIISASSGIAEVLISRVIAAIPSENPDGEMAKLHSVFAFGVVGTVIVCTVFLKLFTYSNWQILAGILCIVPLISIILYIKQPFPYIMEDEGKGEVKAVFSWSFFVCVLCIFFGAATENIMSQWISSYIEKGVGIPKIYGDLFGVALFSLFLGIGRFSYAKIGKNITKVLLISAILSFTLYIIASTVLNPYVALIACALAGFTTAMLWPGTLIAATPRFECAGVAMFALLAAGGDLGASIAPQIMGKLTDTYLKSEACVNYANLYGMAIDEVAMRTALLTVSVFPFVLIIITLILNRILNKKSSNN